MATRPPTICRLTEAQPVFRIAWGINVPFGQKPGAIPTEVKAAAPDVCACARACLTGNRCHWFGYNEETNECSLRTLGAPQQGFETIFLDAPDHILNGDLPRPDPNQFLARFAGDAVTGEECIARCRTTAGCFYVNWNGKECYMKQADVVNNPRVGTGMLSLSGVFPDLPTLPGNSTSGNSTAGAPVADPANPAPGSAPSGSKPPAAPNSDSQNQVQVNSDDGSVNNAGLIAGAICGVLAAIIIFFTLAWCKRRRGAGKNKYPRVEHESLPVRPAAAEATPYNRNVSQAQVYNQYPASAMSPLPHQSVASASPMMSPQRQSIVSESPMMSPSHQSNMSEPHRQQEREVYHRPLEQQRFSQSYTQPYSPEPTAHQVYSVPQAESMAQHQVYSVPHQQPVMSPTPGVFPPPPNRPPPRQSFSDDMEDSRHRSHTTLPPAYDERASSHGGYDDAAIESRNGYNDDKVAHSAYDDGATGSGSAAATSSHRNSSATASIQFEEYYAIREQLPRHHDDLALQEGDAVLVQHYIDGGKCIAVNMTRGGKGICPVDFLKAGRREKSGYL